MDRFEIVEYEPKYAKAISQMWDCSSLGWNGMDVSQTQESVLLEHENSTHLNVYLALKGSEVIGYCSLYKFARDNTALYIQLLNVCPEYHGKGVGKSLVLRCVQRTIELGYGQLDLYTWPGNTKAVPLYKKCGFFWEKRDDATHLMNFVPTVLATEAIKEYFAEVDWYTQTTRSLEIKPDGYLVDGFEFLEYSWQGEDNKLVVEFEKTSRGIRKIETADYAIEVFGVSHKLVFGRKYPIYYRIVNKSGKDLQIDLIGRDDRNIKFSYNQSVTVTDSITLEGEFFVEAITEEQDSWMTHPAVVSEVSINGKSGILKLGIEPKFPATLSMALPYGMSYAGTDNLLYLDVENNFSEPATFTFELPQCSNIAWSNRLVEVRLEEHQRKSIELTAHIHQYSHIHDEVRVTASLDNGELIEYSRNLTIPIRGIGAKLGARSEDKWEVVNGSYVARLDKKDNELIIQRLGESALDFAWSYPKLGKPYSDEFSTKQPNTVDIFQEQDWMVLRATYLSTKYPGVEVTTVTRLRGDGLAQRFYEVANRSLKRYPDLHLNDSFYLPYEKLIAPLAGSFVDVDRLAAGNVAAWDSKYVDENWLFYSHRDHGIGLSWDPSYSLKFGGWDMYFEHDKNLAPGEQFRTKPVTVALHLFADWKTFRSYARQTHTDEPLLEVDTFEVKVNGGNPFVGEQYQIDIHNHKRQPVKTKVEVKSRTDTGDTPLLQVDSSIKLPAAGKGAELLELAFDDGTLEYKQEKALFSVGESKITSGIDRELDLDVHWMDNGRMRIKACKDFAPALFSLKSEEGEWLDSSFPTIGMKSWWNPWSGGLTNTMNKIPLSVLINEPRCVEFATLSDTLGNSWQGLEITCEVKENTDLRGLTLKHYYLLLPDCPVMCHTVQVIQDSGRYLDRAMLHLSAFFNPAASMDSGYLELQRDTHKVKLKAGQEDRRSSCRQFMVGSQERQDKLLVYMDPSLGRINLGVNQQIIRASMERAISKPNGSISFTPPVFFILTREWITNKALRDLDMLRFG